MKKRKLIAFISAAAMAAAVFAGSLFPGQLNASAAESGSGKDSIFLDGDESIVFTRESIKINGSMPIFEEKAATATGDNTDFFYRCAGQRWGYNDLAGRSNGKKRQKYYERILKLLMDVWNSKEDISEDVKKPDEYNYTICRAIYSDLGLTEMEAKETLLTFIYDNPAFYFLSKTYTIVELNYSDGSHANALRMHTYKEYLPAKTRQNIQTQIKKYLSASDSAVAKNNSLYSKALGLHDKLSDDLVYSKKSGDTINGDYCYAAHSIAGGIMNGKGVCECYAKLYQLVCNYCGLDSVYVIGTGKDNSTGRQGNHVWNAVKFDDYTYYSIDVTWDDSSKTMDYFGRGTSFFNSTHVALASGWTSSRYSYALPTLSKTDYSSSSIKTKAHSTHSYGSWTTAYAATCTADGAKTHTCSVCGHPETKAIEATGHKYVNTTVEPTCTKDGYTLHKCSVCGDSYKDNTVKTTGHKYTTKKVAAGCTTGGYTEHTCSVCGNSYRDSETKPAGHSFKETSRKNAGCTTDGESICTCSACGTSYTKVINAAGHRFESTTIAPTATTDGYTEHKCRDCGFTYTDTRIPAGGGNYVLTSTKAATCTQDGENVYTCAETGKSYTVIVKAAGHKFTAKTKTATCTESGCTEHTCSVCSKRYTDCIIPANGHSFVSKNVNAAADKPGYTEHTCQVCGYTFHDNVTAPTSGSYIACVSAVAYSGKSSLDGMKFTILNSKGSKAADGVLSANNLIKPSAALADGSYSAEISIPGYASRKISFNIKSGKAWLGELVLCKYGDLDGNGKFNNDDVILLQQLTCGWNVTYTYKEAADVNCSGKFENDDVILLQQYNSGWKVNLGKAQ